VVPEGGGSWLETRIKRPGHVMVTKKKKPLKSTHSFPANAGKDFYKT